MRCSSILVALLITLSAGIIIISQDTEGVGGVVSFEITIVQDYPGSDPDDPVDLSTGYYGKDETNDPVEPRWIEINGEYGVTSQFTHLLQEIQIAPNASVISGEYGLVDTDTFFEPDILTYSNLMPGETQKQNFTLHLYLDENVPAGELLIELSGTWQNQPGIMGGEIPLTSESPLYISPVVSAYFDDHPKIISMDTTDRTSERLNLVVNGNEPVPMYGLEIIGEQDANNIGVFLDTLIWSDVEGMEVVAYLDIEIETIQGREGESVDIELILGDQESGRDLDSTDIIIQIVEGYQPPPPGPGDDDDDPPGRDDLWSNDQCKRTYTDETGDEVTYWSTLDSSLNSDSGVDLGEDPRVDIIEVETYRENDNLVIEIKMMEEPEIGILDAGIWNTYVFFIDPGSGHEQPPLDLGSSPDTIEEDYEPDEAVASTSIFHSSDWWAGSADVEGNSYVIKGSLSSLMDTGLESDFEVFVKIKFTDLENFATEDSLNTRDVTDYAGYGAWKVDTSKLHSDTDNGDQGDLTGSLNPVMLMSGVIAAVVILLVIIYVVIRVRRN